MRGHYVKFRGRRPGTTPLELAQFARAASPHISARFRHRAGRDARVDDGPLEVHRRVIETNLLGYLYGARLVVRIFREQGHGVLVNVSSAVAYVGQPHMSASRVLRYAAQYKDLDEPLRDFIKRKGGINKCASRFARRQLRRRRERCRIVRCNLFRAVKLTSEFRRQTRPGANRLGF